MTTQLADRSSFPRTMGSIPRRASRRVLALLALALAGSSAAATINVNTQSDTLGGFPNTCSLREAIQSANTNQAVDGCAAGSASGTDIINLPAGSYYIQRDDAAGDEDGNATGDFDISSNLRLQGVSPPLSLIIGDEDGVNSYVGRIVEVVGAGAVADLRSLTITGGNLENQNAGAGLRSEPGTTTTLAGVVVRQNVAGGNAGGILNRATMTINNSEVLGNATLEASQGGGGIFNDDGATLTISTSRVNQNGTFGNGANGSGAGIYNDVGATLSMTNSVVDDNVIDIGGVINGDVEGDGGGIYSRGLLTLVDCTVSNNVARGNDARGGGIFFSPTTDAQLLLERTLVFANRALENGDVSADSTSGGGLLAVANGSVTIRDSIFSANQSTDFGGGARLQVPSARIERTLFVGNNASGNGSGGGGLFLVGGNVNVGARFEIVNTTFLLNSSGGNGGGILVDAAGGNPPSRVELSSSTLVQNTSGTNPSFSSKGEGGGFYADPFVVQMRNTVLAGNLADGDAFGDDCFSTNVLLAGNNLVQSTGFCILAGASVTDKLNVNAQLAAATNNGGLVIGASQGTQAGMLTRAPLPGSPLLDAGNDSGCRDSDNALLDIDQLGSARALDGPDVDAVVRCDIGAIEFRDRLFQDSFE